MINPIRTDFGQTLANLPFWSPSGSGPDDFSCPASEAFTGIEITRNSFDGTEVSAILSPNGNDIWRRSGRDCTVDVKIVGNTFSNVGVADYNFLTARDENGLPRVDSEGNPVFLRDGDGNRIRRNNQGAAAIFLSGPYRKVTISDNTIEGGTYGPVIIDSLQNPLVHGPHPDATPEDPKVDFRAHWRGFSDDAEFVISNNLIRGYNEEGSWGAGAIEISSAKEDTRITISQNRILAGRDSGPRYIISPYMAANGRLQRWCGEVNSTSGDITSTTTFAQLDRAVKPAIVQSYVPAFPYPPLLNGKVVDEGGTRGGVPLPLPASILSMFKPNEQIGPGNAFRSGGLFASDITIGDHDIVRWTSCVGKVLIDLVVRKETKISVVDNDLGYGGEGQVNDVIALYSYAGGLPQFEMFSGNNIGNYEGSLIGGTVLSAAYRRSRASYRLTVEGNYLEGPPLPYVINAVGSGLPTAIVRGDGDDTGPRSGMTVENPPVVPRIERASFGASGRNVIVITYNTALDEDLEPPAGSFTVSWTVPGGGARVRLVPTGVKVMGRTVTLTLSEEVPVSVSGVTATYTAPDGAAALRAEQGGGLAGSDDVSVAEPVDVPPPPAPGAPGDGGCVLASSGSGGIDLGMVLSLVMLTVIALGLKRKVKEG